MTGAKESEIDADQEETILVNLFNKRFRSLLPITKIGSQKFYVKEMQTETELFVINSDFVVISNYSTINDWEFLRKINFSENTGIYIIFNDYSFYVGQTVREIRTRLKEHNQKNSEKLLAEGRIIFFGRTDNAIGKDQLDYLEKRLITVLAEGGRTRINKDSGNVSYISNEHKMLCEYLLNTVERISAFALVNPFTENVLANEEWRDNVLSIFTPELIEKLQTEEQPSIKRGIITNDPILIEYEWPERIGRNHSSIPLNIEWNSSFYIEERDGKWPTDSKEIRKLEEKLLIKHLESINPSLESEENF